MCRTRTASSSRRAMTVTWCTSSRAIGAAAWSIKERQGMKTFSRMLAMIAFLAPGLPAAGESASRLLSQLPRGLQLRQDRPRSYRFVCDYFYMEPLGSLLWKERISGEYSRQSASGGTRWSNVRIARAQGFDDPFPEGR